MIKKTKVEVLAANKMLKSDGLVILTWGNVSARDKESGNIVIKASGAEYSEMTIDDLVVVDLEGRVVEGNLNPSTDLDTHLELYKEFKDVNGIVHTHSTYATICAQIGDTLPCYGTTHADYFKGGIPCTREMTDEEIAGDYEKNTGKVIIERFKNIDPNEMRAVLVHSHGPFVWGDSAVDALHNSIVLENIAKMALFTYTATGGKINPVGEKLLNKHYNRKFGENSYYGQHNSI